MGSMPVVSRVKPKMMVGLVRLFQIFIVIFLIDGFLDITYPLIRLAKETVGNQILSLRGPRSHGPDPRRDIILPISGFPVRHEPGIRNILMEYHSADINISADGRRHNGRGAKEKPAYAGIMLGSSAAFGYGVADSQTISSHLERKLPDIQIKNYAGLPQSIFENTLRWYDLQKVNGRPDFVIIAGISYQLYADCAPQSPVVKKLESRSNIFVHMSEKFSEILSHQKVMPCSSDESLDLAIRSSLLAIESAIAFGRKNGTPLYIVYLPTPYDAAVNVDGIFKSAGAKEKLVELRRVFGRYHRELTRLNLPEVIDLSGVLPSDKTYFLDTGGHLSREGNEIISEMLRRRIWGDSGMLGRNVPKDSH